MISIRLMFPLGYHHFEIPAGTIIAVPAGIANMAVQRGIAEFVGPQHAVVEPQETRARRRKP